MTRPPFPPFCVALSPQTPPEILMMLQGYVDDAKGIRILWCSKVDISAGAFAGLHIRKIESPSEEWTVAIPIGCILASFDMRENKVAPSFFS